MSKLLILQGLPASGKSTWAKQMVQKGAGDWKRVNKDDLRAMIHCGLDNKGTEGDILVARDALVRAYLAKDKSVIIDDTNFNPIHIKMLKAIANEQGATVELKRFDISVDEAISRDRGRDSPVGEKAIRDMYDRYIAVGQPAKIQYVPPVDKPSAIICDIDGTLAHMDGRSPYEWQRVDEDSLDHIVAEIVGRYKLTHQIILVSGRDEESREKTIKWCERHGIVFDILLMRAAGDMRNDRIVKKEIFESQLKDNYNIHFVLDDRNSVVAMWRSMGLKVLQVEEGDF
jgi:predicted kinase